MSDDNNPLITINLVGNMVLLVVKSDSQEKDYKVANHFHKMIAYMVKRYLENRGCEPTITVE